jgi:hypothetical protein
VIFDPIFRRPLFLFPSVTHHLSVSLSFSHAHNLSVSGTHTLSLSLSFSHTQSLSHTQFLSISVLHGLNVLEDNSPPLPPSAPPLGAVVRGGGRPQAPHQESEGERLDREQAEEKDRDIQRGRESLMCRMKEAERLRQREVLAKGIQSKRVKAVEFSAQVHQSPVRPLPMRVLCADNCLKPREKELQSFDISATCSESHYFPLHLSPPFHSDPSASSSGSSAGEASIHAEGEGGAAEEGSVRGPSCSDGSREEKEFKRHRGKEEGKNHKVASSSSSRNTSVTSKQIKSTQVSSTQCVDCED